MVIRPSTIQGPQVRSIIIIFLMKRHYFGLKNININQFTESWVDLPSYPRLTKSTPQAI
jgi:predicted component of type VI protein secretion system